MGVGGFYGDGGRGPDVVGDGGEKIIVDAGGRGRDRRGGTPEDVLGKEHLLLAQVMEVVWQMQRQGQIGNGTAWGELSISQHSTVFKLTTGPILGAAVLTRVVLRREKREIHELCARGPPKLNISIFPTCPLLSHQPLSPPFILYLLTLLTAGWRSYTPSPKDLLSTLLH